VDTYITATEARQRFLQLFDDVQQGDEVIVTRHDTSAVVLIDFERLETLKSLTRLWQDPEALRTMKEANEQVKTGRVLRMKGRPKIAEIARAQGLLRG
jgi:prevent-host-death family protein